MKPTLAPWAGPSEQWVSVEAYFIRNGEKLGPKRAPLEGVMTRKSPGPLFPVLLSDVLIRVRTNHLLEKKRRDCFTRIHGNSVSKCLSMTLAALGANKAPFCLGLSRPHSGGYYSLRSKALLFHILQITRWW